MASSAGGPAPVAERWAYGRWGQLLVSLFIFATWPTPTMLFGTAIVISAGLFVIYREHRLGIQRSKSKQAQTPTTPLS